MDESMVRNRAELRGVLAAAPAYSHSSRGEQFFVFPVETRRLSGTPDVINVIARRSLLERAEAYTSPASCAASTTSAARAPGW